MLFLISCGKAGPVQFENFSALQNTSDGLQYDGISDPVTNSEWQKISQAVFIPKCIGCHTKENDRGGLRLDSYQFLIDNLDTYFDVNRPDNSLLYQRIISPRRPMPPKNSNIAPLDDAEKKLVLDWILTLPRQ